MLIIQRKNIELTGKEWFVTVSLLKPGSPRQWKPIRWQNWNNRFQHFQIQPIKCPVQNNEILTCSLTGDVYTTMVSVNDKLKPVVLSCALYGYRNNYMLHSVYFRSLVDLENKNCVRVPLVNIYRQSICRVWIFSRLKKSPSNAFRKLFEWNCSQTYGVPLRTKKSSKRVHPLLNAHK